MFKVLERDGLPMGFVFRHGDTLAFFGTRHTNREDLARLFPALEFRFLKQVHGCAVIPAAAALHEADGHYTSEAHAALVVQSADCVPLLLGDTQRVCAVHAGWRGVAQNIVAAVREAMPDFQPKWAAIGPHIRTFEVGADVAAQLRQAAPGGTILTTPSSPGKVYFDLTALVRAQLQHNFGLAVADTGGDTLKDSRFHSYRREGKGAGRQYSFVVNKAGKFASIGP